MVKIVKVTKESLSIFKYFIPDFFNLNENDICFGAISKNKLPLAVILAKFECEKCYCVNNFIVFYKVRNMGIGSALLNKMKSELKKKEYAKFYFKLVIKSKNLNYVLEFLKKRGFFKSKVLCKIYKKSASSIWEESKFVRYMLSHRKINLSENFKIIRFKEIPNVTKKNAIKDATAGYPPVLSPFVNENNLEDANSLFILDRAEDKLVAWLTSFYAPGNCILYRSFFVNEEYKEYSFGKLLLKKAVEKHESDFFSKDLIFAVSLDNKKVDKALTKYFTMEKENTSYEVIIE